MKAVLIGTGWRAHFYKRIAEALPDLLNIVSVFSNSSERAMELSRSGVNCYSSLEEALSFSHDAVIVATARSFFYPIMKELIKKGEFILSETSFLPLSEEEKAELRGAKGAVMEQYPYDPMFAAVISCLPRLGRIDQLYISGLHNHHSASLARIILGLEEETAEELLFTDFDSRITKTGERSKMSIGGFEEEYTRKLRILRFKESLFIHDFSSNQYNNYLIPKRIEIRGEKGILTLDGLATTDEKGYPVQLPFKVYRDTSTWKNSLALSHITLSGETVYVNPFYPAEINDDEIGIAMIIRNIEEDRPYRTIEEGIKDAVLGSLL